MHHINMGGNKHLRSTNKYMEFDQLIIRKQAIKLLPPDVTPN